MTQLGELLLDLGKPTAAREELRHALAAAVSTSDSSREGDVHRDLAKVARFVGEPSDALTEIQLAMQKHNDDVEKSIDLEIWAWIDYDMGSLDSAREHTEKGLSLAKSVSFQKEIGQHQHIRGRIEQLAGNNTGANTYYSDALRIFDSLGYLRGKGEVLYSIAYLHYEAAWARVNSQDDLEAAKPEFEQAKKEFEDVLKLFELSDYREGIARAYGGIGVTLAFLFPEQPELAISDFRRSLEIARDIQYPLVEANQLGNLGIMYKRAVQLSLGNKAEQITEAKKNLESALSIHRRIGYKLGEGKQLTNLAELKFSTGDYCGAASLIKQAISVFDRLNAKPLLERARSFAEAIDQQCSKIKSPTN